MGHEDLIARLERDAAAREAAVRERADAEVAALRAAAGVASGRHRDQALAEGRAARAVELEREQALARAKGRAAVLRAQHGLLDRVHARALQRCGELGAEPRLLAALPGLLLEALQHLEGVSATVRAAPALLEALRPLALSRPALRLQADPTVAAGLVVEADDGSVLIDNTMPSRLERLRPHLGAQQLAQVKP